MRYAILARDSFSAGSDDGALYTLVIEVEAGSRSDAHAKATKLAEGSELDVEACHDGACYEVVQTKEEILDAVNRLRAEHNALHELARVIDTKKGATGSDFDITLGEENPETFCVDVKHGDDGDDHKCSITFRPDDRGDQDRITELLEEAVWEFGEPVDGYSVGPKYTFEFRLDDFDGFRTKHETKKSE